MDKLSVEKTLMNLFVAKPIALLLLLFNKRRSELVEVVVVALYTTSAFIVKFLGTFSLTKMNYQN